MLLICAVGLTAQHPAVGGKFKQNLAADAAGGAKGIRASDNRKGGKIPLSFYNGSRYGPPLGAGAGAKGCRFYIAAGKNPA